MQRYTIGFAQNRKIYIYTLRIGNLLGAFFFCFHVFLVFSKVRRIYELYRYTFRLPKRGCRKNCIEFKGRISIFVSLFFPDYFYRFIRCTGVDFDELLLIDAAVEPQGPHLSITTSSTVIVQRRGRRKINNRKIGKTYCHNDEVD